MRLRIGVRILTTVVLISTPAFAQYAEDVLRFSQFGLGVGARSLGMGNASVGSSPDYATLFWNPAGLASLRNYEFSLGLSYLGYGNTTRFLGTKTTSKSDATNLNNLGLVYPVPTVRGSLTLAFGFQRVAGYTSVAELTGFNSGSSMILARTPVTNLSGLSPEEVRDLLDNNIPFQLYLADTSNGQLYPLITGNVQQTARIVENGGINHWSFGGALDVAKDLSLGASLSLVSGTYGYTREYEESDVRGVYTKDPSAYYGEFDHFSLVSTINSELSGFNANFGLMYRKQGKYKLGVTVRTPTYYTIQETFSDEARSRFDPNSDGSIDRYDIAFDGKTEYRIVTPVVLSAGGSVQFRDLLVLSADLEYTDWTQMKFDTDNSELEAENRLIQRIYRSTFNIRSGAELTFWDWGLIVRGGFVLNPSPYKDDPAEFDQKYYTAGIGIELDEGVFLNAAYAFGEWKTFRDNYTLPGMVASRTNEHIRTNNVNVTLSFRF